jgi:phosphatidylserine/phosphatidylglycerophosphate/cardiolipin synthase-like enzyme
MRMTAQETWLLSEAEMTSSHGGVPRGLPTSTEGNSVSVLVDGAAYFHRLLNNLRALEPGDSVYIAGWRLRLDTLLDPVDATSKLSELLRALVLRGVTVRALLWRNQVETVEETAPGLLALGVEICLDARHPALGSHHQKFVVTIASGICTAFCGGIELVGNRFDTPAHEPTPGAPVDPAGVTGWHDVQVELQGPAALDVEQTFRSRWNAPERASIHSTNPEPISTASPLSPASGQLPVQVLRTFACRGGKFSTIAPKGEQSILHVYLKAIRNAKRYVYIEDQYLVSPEIADAIKQVLPNIEAFIAVVPRRVDEAELVAEAINFNRAAFVKTLSDVDASKVLVCDLVQPETGRAIFVHSKVLIIDDEVAVIGSANVNHRSMTHDSELSVAVVNASTGPDMNFVQRLRVQLWAEHLGLEAETTVLDEISASIQTWRERSGSGSGHAQRHTVGIERTDLGPAWSHIIDPNGSCSGGGGGGRPDIRDISVDPEGLSVSENPTGPPEPQSTGQPSFDSGGLSPLRPLQPSFQNPIR